MEDKNRLLFVHAVIVLPDGRILLRKLCHENMNINTGKWTATIERGISKKDSPGLVVTEAVASDFNLDLTVDYKVPKVTIKSFNSITIYKYNRKIFPFIVNIKKMVTLKSEVNYQFSAVPFPVLLTDIRNNATYYHKLSKINYTLNTVHVIKEVQLKDV